MESNGDWEKALQVLEKEYPYQHKVTLENTYGMHFYSKMKIEESKTHYFVADDIPSIEAHLKTEDGFEFVFFWGSSPTAKSDRRRNFKGKRRRHSKRCQTSDRNKKNL